MENSYTASTVEVDHEGFQDLQHQLMNVNQKQESKEQPKRDAPLSSSKKYVFRKGEDSLEVDDDYEIEFVADKKPTRLTLREMKDRAAGDIAVKNRMHSLAEEKKRVQATLRQFAEIAKDDPLGALEYISNQAKEADSEFEYNKYLEKLADQAERLGQMGEPERKAWELEKKLKKAEQDLSTRERQQAVISRKQEMQESYPEIGDRQFAEMVDAVLSTDELMEGLENEHDVMNRVEDLIKETLTQRDIITCIKDINPAHVNNNTLIFHLSDQLKQNPDLDEEDVRDILQEIIGEAPVRPVQQTQRDRDIRTLSNKARQAAPESSLRMQNASAYDLLKQQLMDRKQELSKTPLYKR